MSERRVDDRVRVPEYELEQYFPEEKPVAEATESLREQHGRIRTYFISRPERYRQLQRWLNQARMGTTYDEYLTRSVIFAAVAALVGLVVGVLLTFQMAALGVFETLQAPFEASGGIVTFVAANRVLFGGAALTVLSTVLLGGGTWAGRYYYPRYVADSRARSIDIALPHGIVYMYALSSGGMNTLEVIKEVAEVRDIHGEVANEFDMIVRDVELFGNDLFTALRDARNLTPSDNLEQFLDDMISVLDSGSDITAFLESESETYMQEAREEQDSFLETLSILSEIFVVSFVAAPLFIIVTLVVLSLLGGEALAATYIVVYLILPLGMIGYLLMIDLLSQPYTQTSGTLVLEGDERFTIRQEVEELVRGPSDPGVREDEDFEEYWEAHQRDEVRDRLRNPIRTIERKNPLLSLVVTVPLAGIAFLLMTVFGDVTLSAEAFRMRPVATTVGAVMLPFLIVAVPLTLYYEGKRRHELRIAERFPDTLNLLSSANQMGIRLAEALDLVSRWSEGVIAEELRKTHNDIVWNHDTQRALLSFANRLDIPEVTRTLHLIAKGARANTDIANILRIAAEDTRNYQKIKEKRRQSMGAYIAIVIIGFLVYMTVIVLLNIGYLKPIAEVGSQAASSAQGPLLNLSEVPVQSYRMMFFHSALIQAVGSGLIAGKLAENDVLSGLKYSVSLVLITLVVFTLV